MQSPLYLGFDLSTQQLKCLAVSSDLKVHYESKFDFDADAQGFDVVKGVLTNEKEHEVYAPVALWLQAVDVVLQALKDKGLDFGRVKGISGAGQQHGSVYWSHGGERLLQGLDPSKKLEEQLDGAFSHPFSPNWQDASTQKECDEFDRALGNVHELASQTGSKAHHRFTGPQILRFRRKHAAAYDNTAHISLVSSFLASIFVGQYAPIDISDVCGMNLWHVRKGTWDAKLLDLASSGNAKELASKLGPVPEDGGARVGGISPYFVKRYDFDPSCSVVAFTGDNPSTILALPLRPMDAMVSLGTSTTFLMSTPEYRTDPSVHFFNHPTTAGLYMFMLCYKNGGLAREQIRDAINADSSNTWEKFDQAVTSTPPLGQQSPDDPMKLGLYFPRPEIVPNVRAGSWRYTYSTRTGSLEERSALPAEDARTIVESQVLSLRLRSKELVRPPSPNPNKLPAQARRIYLVGGGSRNVAIAKVVGEVLGSVEGVYKLDVGENACALGAAYKAVWAVERGPGETFEELIGGRWKEDMFVQKLQEGYQRGVFETYGEAVEAFARMEELVLRS